MLIARDEDGRPLRMVGTHTDITEHKLAEAQQRALEMQLRESQKMEAIGTLAGGVAHDFNNLLAAILGNLVLAREDVGEGHAAQESLTEINRAAIRARQLVQQILTFSRRQTQEMVRQPLTPLVEEALGLMRSLLPAGIKLVSRLPGRSLPVMADATQMQQVLDEPVHQRLAGHGRPAGRHHRGAARGEPGRLEGAATGWCAQRCLCLPERGRQRPGHGRTHPAPHLRAFLHDQGARCRHRPGSGGGSRHRQGASRRHPDSESPGRRARVSMSTCRWPRTRHAGRRVTRCATSRRRRRPARPAATSGKHVIYIDDYEALVFLVGRLLRKQGYRASTFESGEAALDWLRAHPQEPVDLLVSDQNMAGLSGVEVAHLVHAPAPGRCAWRLSRAT